MAQTTLTLNVTFDEQVTDPESLATAADCLLATALSTPGILAEYGNPQFDECFVDTSAAESEPNATCTLRRWVLYDLDSDVLLRTKAYSEYDEAAEDAAQANDILVLPLVIQGIVM